MARTKDNKPNRTGRISLKDQRDSMTVVGAKPGFEQRWVNDVDDRIERFKKAGWTPVGKDEVQVGEEKVDTNDSSTVSYQEKYVGQKTKAVLMEIPTEWYEEDQKAKQVVVDEMEEQMKRDNRANSDYGSVETHRRRI